VLGEAHEPNQQSKGVAKGLRLPSRSRSPFRENMVAHPPKPLVCWRSRKCGFLKQEDSPDQPVLVAGNPEALHIATDEGCRNCPVDDGGIEGLKLRSYGCCGPIGPQSFGVFALVFDCSARRPFPSSPQQINPSHAYGADERTHPAMLTINAMVRSKPMQKIGE
jgi:hypothetical protein